MIRDHHWWADCVHCEISVAVIGTQGQRLADPTDEDACEQPMDFLDCPYCGKSLIGWSEGGAWNDAAPTVPADAVFED